MSIELDKIIAPSFFGLHGEIRNGKYNEYWLKGGRGSTKSTFISIQIILGMLKDTKANAVILRRYQNELRDTVYGQIEWTIHKMGLESLFEFKISPMQIINKKTGQKIVFRAADNPKKLKSINLGKGYIKYSWCEELDQFANMEEIRDIEQSLFRGEDDHKRISFRSYNPPKSSRSWVNQEVKIPKEGKRVHHSDYRDVPKHWLGERFLADAEHLRKVNETAYRHEYLGEEVGTGLEVFHNITIESLDDMVQHFTNIRQGLDFGYAVDPLAFNRMHYDTKKRRLYIFREISGINLFNRQFWEMAKVYNDVLTIADSAEPKSIAELKSYGMRIKGAKKGQGSVEFGIKFLQDLEQIIIDPTYCPRASKEFTNYALETDRQGEVKSQFPDKENHCIDNIRYALQDESKSKIQFLK